MTEISATMLIHRAPTCERCGRGPCSAVIIGDHELQLCGKCLADWRIFEAGLRIASALRRSGRRVGVTIRRGDVFWLVGWAT